MKSLMIIRRELLQQMKSYKIILVMTILPILIITIMGLVFDSDFSPSIDSDSLNVAYTVDEQSDFSTALLLGLDQTLNIIETTEEKGLEGIADNNVTVYINITGNHVALYKNDTFYRSASVVENYIDMFITKYEIIEVTGTVNLKSYTTVTTVSVEDESSILDYFGIAMCLLFVLYGMSLQISSVIKEKTENTLYRMQLAPVKRTQILFGKIMGNILIATIQVTLVMVTTIVFFDVNWGNPIKSWVLLETFVVLSVAMGISFGCIFKSEDKAMGFIHIAIFVFGFLGGSYMPLEGLGFLGKVGKFISPLWWTNTGLFASIYYPDMSYYLSAIAINIGLTALLIVLSAQLLKRNEVIDA